MTGITLTPEQREVAEQALDFIEIAEHDTRLFSNPGSGRTGKPSCSSGWPINSQVRFCCAPSWARPRRTWSRKSGLAASTIHSSIYEFLGKEKTEGMAREAVGVWPPLRTMTMPGAVESRWSMKAEHVGRKLAEDLVANRLQGHRLW